MVIDVVRGFSALLGDMITRVTLLERRLLRIRGGTATAPAGALIMFAGDTAPSGYLIANGSSYLPAEYPELFDVIGFAYGNDAGRFRVPDMRGRTPVGRNPGDSDFGSLNDAPGTKTHTLTAAQTPVLGTNSAGAHSHNLGNRQVWTADGGAAFPNGAYYSANNTVGTLIGTNSAGAHSHAVNSGGGGAHNNIQPSRTVNFIIKT